MKKNVMLALVCHIIYPIFGMENNMKLINIDTFEVFQGEDGSTVFELDDYTSENTGTNSSSTYSIPSGFEFKESDSNPELRRVLLSYHKLLHSQTQTMIKQEDSKLDALINNQVTFLKQIEALKLQNNNRHKKILLGVGLLGAVQLSVSIINLILAAQSEH